MSHDHHHHFHHDHHGSGNHTRAFAIGVSLNVAFILVEVIFGLRAGSLALLADAGHNLSDVFSLLISWGAAFAATRPPSGRRTYGFRRASIMAALTNAVILLIAVGGIAWESVIRFGSPSAPTGGTIMLVAGIGVLINGVTALLFIRGSKSDLNIRGAYVHMAADTGVSLGVVAAGMLIQFTGASWIDPVVSLVIAGVIAVGTLSLLRDSMNLALDAVPPGIDLKEVRDFLERQPAVTGVHDLHIWAMSTTETALTAHLVRSRRDDDDALLVSLSRELKERFQIGHATIQLENEDSPHACPQAAEGAV